MAKYGKAETTAAIEHLREVLKPGDEVRTILRHVSRSGVSRAISCVVVRDSGLVYTPDWHVARALGLSEDDRHDGLKIGGCGMDMGFELVYRLSSRLFPEGFECVGDGCPSNDHFNGDRDRTPHHHTDGGYALRQRWL